MTTDYRAICAELSKLDGHCVVDCTEEWADAMCRLRAALAQPEPEGPTAKELRQIFDDQSGYINDDQVMWWSDFQAAAKALLQRYAQ